MKRVLVSVLGGILSACAPAPEPVVTGDLMVWRPVTITFSGPKAAEQDARNPFTDYRLDVSFQGPAGGYVVPGYYAADGDAAESGADAGNKWRVHFIPDAPGEWTYRASFRSGKGVAVAEDPAAGSSASFDGAHGSFTVAPSPAAGSDPASRGLLRYTGGHYLQYAATGQRFLKHGADSPENLLAYEDFDGTWDRGRGGQPDTAFLHTYKPHVRDWREGDPTWRGGKGKGLIGGLNYLAGKGVNAVYFLTQNISGDGDDVWPWVDPEDYSRFDCSKLDQWEIVFRHMDRLGIMLHVVTAETENDHLLDEGELGPQRKLYYRELIARFGHHLALVWNLGEENRNTADQIKAFSRYIHELDPYDHPVVMHTHSTPEHHEKRYGPLLGYEFFEGASMQVRDDEIVHSVIAEWVARSAAAGRPWVVTFDEQRTGATGVEPDAVDPWHDGARHLHLWATLLAGGAGIEWFFGYNHPDHDLSLEDWRSRDNLWDITRWAIEFMHRELPFWEMRVADDLTSSADDFVFAKAGDVFAIYLPVWSNNRLDLGKERATYTVRWFNPRAGGELLEGSVKELRGPGRQLLGQPPADRDKDWVVLVKRAGGTS